jgi:hypothetical protein
MDSPSPPPVPDPVATANAQGAANNESARTTTQLNRANQVTPYGSQNWTHDGDQWTSTINLDPRIQQALDTQLNTSNGMAGAIQQALARVNGTLGQDINYAGLPQAADARQSFMDANSYVQDHTSASPLRQDANWNANSGLGYGQAGHLSVNGPTPQGYDVGTLSMDGLPGVRRSGVNNNATIKDQQGVVAGTQDALQGAMGRFNGMGALPTANDETRKRVEDALYQRETSRLDPQFQQTEDSIRSTLLNRGITEGSEAWNNELQNFGRNKNDAYSTAMWDAITKGGAEQSRLLGDQLGIRQQGTNEYGAASGVNTNAVGALTSMLGQQVQQQQADTQQRGTEAGIRQGQFTAQNSANNSKYNSDIGWFNAKTGADQSAFSANEQARIAQQGANTGLFTAQNNASQGQFEAENRARALQQGLDYQRSGLIGNMAHDWYGMQGDQRSRALSEQEGARNRVLNELASLRSGAQVQTPQFGQTPSGAMVQPAPIAQSIWNAYQGNMNAYNAEVGSNNSMTGGIFSILAALAGKPG